MLDASLLLNESVRVASQIIGNRAASTETVGQPFENALRRKNTNGTLNLNGTL